MAPIDIYMYRRQAPYYSVRGSFVVQRLTQIGGEDFPPNDEHMTRDTESWRWVGEVDSPEQAQQYADHILATGAKIDADDYVSTAKGNEQAVVHGMYNAQYIGGAIADNDAIQPASSLTQWQEQSGGVPAPCCGGGSSISSGNSGGAEALQLRF